MKKYVIKYMIEAEGEIRIEELDRHLKENVFPYSRDIKLIPNEYEKNFSEYERHVQGFSMTDIIGCAENDCAKDITEEEADEIMDVLEKRFDASIGMSWDTIAFWINKYFQGEES
ncbi:MAG: hypothetical protein PF518_04940 [Spirochaetaceae bacterium]|jgi:hypothetical protein|nr:hypothetical protein [Spirochaetaceae bacterium]